MNSLKIEKYTYSYCDKYVILVRYCCVRHSSTCIKIKRRILRRMTSFGRTKVKKTSKSDQAYRILKSPFYKGLQGYERKRNGIKKIPDNEVA